MHESTVKCFSAHSEVQLSSLWRLFLLIITSRCFSSLTGSTQYLKASSLSLSLSHHQSGMSVPRVLSPQEDGSSLLKPSDHIRAGEIKYTLCVIKPGAGRGHLLSAEPQSAPIRVQTGQYHKKKTFH